MMSSHETIGKLEIHLAKGDLAARDVGGVGLIASDVAARIPQAIRQYQEQAV